MLFVQIEDMTGRIEVNTLCGLDATYYEQPEFYGSSFKDVAISFYKDVDTSHWTPEGYGTFLMKWKQ